MYLPTTISNREEPTCCQTRQDLKQTGSAIPAVNLTTGRHVYIDLDDWQPCRQPVELTDKEFNVRVSIGVTKFLVSSIDVEFNSRGSDE